MEDIRELRERTREIMGMSYREHLSEVHQNNVDLLKQIQPLDIKKGDVLLLKMDDSNPKDLPRHVHNKIMIKQCEAVKGAFEQVFGNTLHLIFIPKSLDIEVIRLEEWFV